jgi:hypothetical protein
LAQLAGSSEGHSLSFHAAQQALLKLPVPPHRVAARIGPLSADLLAIRLPLRRLLQQQQQ